MNKLGFYLHNSQDANGLWDAINRVKPPVVLIHMDSKNDMLLEQMRQFRSPDTFVVGRYFVPLSEQSNLLSHPDPSTAGRAYAEELINKDPFFIVKRAGDSNRLLVDAWMSLNECLPGPFSKDWLNGTDERRAEIRQRAANYDKFQVAFRQRLKDHNQDLEAVAFNFGAGNFQRPHEYVEWFPETLEHFTYLGFHEYGWPVMFKQQEDQTFKSGVGLYRKVLEGIRTLPEYGERHKAIITEAGLARAYLHDEDPAGDVGWLYENDTISQDSYWQSLQQYNAMMIEDNSYAIGACLYEVGWQSDWKTFRLLGEDNQGNKIEIIDRIAESLVEG